MSVEEATQELAQAIEAQTEALIDRRDNATLAELTARRSRAMAAFLAALDPQAEARIGAPRLSMLLHRLQASQTELEEIAAP
jgi:hypothetical protein